jgi:hypothetical protein
MSENYSVEVLQIEGATSEFAISSFGRWRFQNQDFKIVILVLEASTLMSRLTLHFGFAN